MIGAAEARSLLAPEPVRLLPGIGPALARRLAAQGITLLGHLQALSDREARAPAGRRRPVAGARARAARTYAGSIRAARPNRSAPKPPSMPT